ncbi:MAG: CRTAC1 family protein [Kiloniellales bacterium]|nr:CRTAC1 family protein [Kiloniellales bacterium]
MRAAGLLLPLLLGAFSPALAGDQTSVAGPETVRSIVDAIQSLEGDRDPKCHATATRLENFMYGTPLSPAARHEKIVLQKQLIRAVWGRASERGVEAGRQSVAEADIAPAAAVHLSVQSTSEGGHLVIATDGTRLPITRRDYEHYSSVAYALRAVLAVEQEQLLDPDQRLLPLSEEAVAVLEDLLNLHTLATLQLADRLARAEDRREISADGLRSAWLQVGAAPAAAEVETVAGGAAAPPRSDFGVIKSVVRQKIASYAAYNEISLPVFLRNLQVYFARYRWPKDPETAKAFTSFFTETMVAFVIDTLRLADQRARAAGHAVIRAEDVEPVVERFIPFRVNAYEDVIFFPRLAGEQVVLESYDVDSFRDSGLHWHYLQFALDHPTLDVTLEPDPFAAELIVEGVAQFGVLALRMAGIQAKEAKAETLTSAFLESGLREIQRRIDAHASAPAVEPRSQRIHSSLARAETPHGKAFFTDVTAEAGIAFEHRSADWLSRLLRSYLRKGPNVGTLAIPPAFGGAGVAAEDIDDDGLADVLLVGGLGNALYLNRGDGTFRDISAEAGLSFRRPDGHAGEARQPVIADFDNDGLQDILITYVNDDHRLYRGLGGGRFQDVSAEAGLGGGGLVGGPAVVFDYDRDGLLDLYIGYFGDYLHGVMPTLSRRNTNGLPNRLFRNLGGFRFKDVTAGSGLDNRGWTQAASHTDLDGDGWQDVIVGNDFGVNGYYRNLGNGRFEDIAPKLGTDKPSFTMNVGIADVNRDLFPDIYISNIVTMAKDDKYTMPSAETPMHFDPVSMARMRVVEANDLFTSVAEGRTLLRYRLSDAVARGLSSTGWAWDADFFDFDNDGDDDLYCLNGMNEYAVYSDTPYYTSVHDEKMEISLPVAQRETNVFFVNEGGKLQNRSEASGADLTGNSRSAAYLDIENDGDLDVVLNNYHGAAVLYRNELEAQGRNWLKVRLVGDPALGSNRDAIGSRLVLRAEPGLQVWREVHGTIGYLSVHPREQHFGLGGATEGRLTITWPNGQSEEVGPLAANRRYVITQGRGAEER